MYSPDELRLDVVFGALAHPLRREMLQELQRWEVSATAFRLRHEISQPAMSRHVRVLRQANLIRQKIVGSHRPCRLSDEGFRSVIHWLEPFRDAATPVSNWIHFYVDPDLGDDDEP